MAYRKVIKRVRRIRIVRKYRRTIRLIRKELKRKDIKPTAEKKKVLLKRIVAYRYLIGGNTYFRRVKRNIRRLTRIIKKKPSTTISRKIIRYRTIISYRKTIIKRRSVIRRRRRIFRQVIVKKRVYAKCVKMRRSIKKNVLKKWNAAIRKFQAMVRKSTTKYQKKVYNGKITYYRYLKNRRGYPRRLSKRLRAYKTKFYR